MTTSNKNFLFKRDRSRDIVNSLIASNANYKYRLTRPKYNTVLFLLGSLTLFVWQLLMHNFSLNAISDVTDKGMSRDTEMFSST